MFEFFQGVLDSSGPDFAVVNVHGVGYRLGTSMNSFASLPETGKEVKLFAHYHVTENSQALYGFASQEERDLFRILISVNKVGPKVGLSILSTLTVEQIVSAVENQDNSGLKAVPGIGPKTASRLLLELKGKLNIAVISSGDSKSSTKERPVERGLEDEAFTALIALGYTDGQVRQALALVKQEVATDAPVETWITLALKVI